MHIEDSLTTVSVLGTVVFATGSMTAAKVFAGLTEKYTMPVPVAVPSETVTSTPTRPTPAHRC